MLRKLPGAAGQIQQGPVLLPAGSGFVELLDARRYLAGKAAPAQVIDLCEGLAVGLHRTRSLIRMFLYMLALIFLVCRRKVI
jgi:hypothetical protein